MLDKNSSGIETNKNGITKRFYANPEKKYQSDSLEQTAN